MSMTREELRRNVCAANRKLASSGLVEETWGNASAIDRETDIVAIKPSGVPYDALTPEKIVLVSLDGSPVEEGASRPSSDTPTHLCLYRAFPQIGGIAHSHSSYATMFAQACRPLPCLGTTHADHFYGTVPVTRDMRPEDVEQDYEVNTGKLIVQTLGGHSELAVPAILVARHGPFTWGEDADSAVTNSVVLELVAQMALGTLQLNPDADALPDWLLDRHFLRKHGPQAYYGQP